MRELGKQVLPKMNGASSDEIVDGEDVIDNREDDETVEPTIAQPEVDAYAQGVIGRRLSTFYGELVAQPVPDTFVELLKRLQEKETGK